jgi:hypothetical protein
VKRYPLRRAAHQQAGAHGVSHWKVIHPLRKQLQLNASALQVPIGVETEGIVDSTLLTKSSACDVCGFCNNL